MLTQMRRQIDHSLGLFMDRMKKDYQLHLVDPVLFSSMKEYVLRKGKRIRPLLMILSYKGFRKSAKRMSPSIYYVSTCIELLHNFMLIHDDIIDRSDLRRGKPTLHRVLRRAAKTPEQDKLGYDLGIVAGDIVYALAIDAFLSIKEEPKRKERALKYFIQTAVYTAMGEFVDTLNGVRPLPRITEKDVFLNYSLKTARYTFDCPLVVGAILAGAKEKDIKALAQIGLLVGQAFQIQDDVIGIFDTEKNIGKSILSDLAEQKKTILVTHAFSRMNTKEKAAFKALFEKPVKTHSDLKAVRKIFLEHGSLDYSLAAVKVREEKARGLLNALSINDRYRRLIKKSLLTLFRHSEKIARQNGIDWQA